MLVAIALVIFAPPSLMCVGVALARKTPASAALLAVALAATASGCLSDLVPLTPPVGSDGGSSLQTADVSCGDAGMSSFECGMWPGIKQLGCPGCHSGGPPMKLIAFPRSASDWTASYMEFSARAKSGAMSLVLTKNLAGSGVPHGGGSPFASTSEPTYVAWLDWINAGAPQ